MFDNKKLKYIFLSTRFGSNNKFFGLFELLAISIFSVVSITLQISHANPEGGVVTKGQAIISSSENHFVVVKQETTRAIIDWKQFNIAAQEQTRFIQPDSNSIALNRIHSNTASIIDGHLTANGKLILINQNGILFNKSAVVDVNGLLATTSNISNDKFMQQEKTENLERLLAFEQPGLSNGKIINDGQINATDGLVGLVAPTVVNTGTIIAKTGKVQLVSGEIFTLDLYGDNLINVAVSEDLSAQLVLNHGKIIADGNQIILTTAGGKQLISSLIANTGALQARSVVNKSGEIIIMAEGSNAVINNVAELKRIDSQVSKVIISGIIDASGLEPGQSGGKVQILGDNIRLLDSAVINVSGHTGKYNTTLGLESFAKRIGAAGGEVLIGGDYLGKGKTPTAIELNVGPGAIIYSDSVEVGDAGRVILWSDGLTSFNGTIYARSLGGLSGNNYGNGGFVETSGSKKLIATGQVDLLAANGAVGTYLLDPSNISIFSNAAILDPNASRQLTYDLTGTGTTEINANYLQNQNNNLHLLADNIVLNLNNDTINLTNSHSIIIEARNSIDVSTNGNVVTDGGDITIKLDEGDLNLTKLTLSAANTGLVSLQVIDGSLTLGTVNAGSMVARVEAIKDLIIPVGKQLSVRGQNTPLKLYVSGAFKNLNTAGTKVFNLTDANARWLLYVGEPAVHQGIGVEYIGSRSEELGYDNSVLPTQPGNFLVRVPILLGNYDNPNAGIEKTVTFNNLAIVGPDASNYTLGSNTILAGPVGYVDPKVLSVVLKGSVSKTYDGNTMVAVHDDNYTLEGLVGVDVVTLENS